MSVVYPIRPVDTVRTPDSMKAADKEGIEGRWLDVPRLQQKNSENQSNYWCGRTSASMIVNYYSKFLEKAGEYIGHAEGKPGVGSNGNKFNLRWLGGSHKDDTPGVSADGKCWPEGAFKTMGWSSDNGELGPSDSMPASPDDAYAEKIFARHIDQLKKNNPVVQYTQLTKHKGHIVVICGYKKDKKGQLWLRINDPCYPHFDLILSSNYQVITQPGGESSSFSEYWLRARRLLEMYPGRTTRLFAHADRPKGYFEYCIPPKPLPDSHALVHLLVAQPQSDGAGVPAPETSPAPASTTPAAGGATPAAGGATPAPKPKEDEGAPPQPAACPPSTGNTRLPFAINQSTVVTGEAITSLYHMMERGLGGFFPLGDAGLFHSGAHLVPEINKPVFAVADAELVAARIGMNPGEHAWGDTGFVILRHPVKAGGADKNVYCLYIHLRREPLHPDHTTAPWLKKLLIEAMKDPDKKPKWRIIKDLPTWKDDDKGRFSPANVQNDKVLQAGVYEEEDELVNDGKRYIKVKGKSQWVRTSGVAGDEGNAKELSPWADFDLEVAAKKSPLVKNLKDGKVAVFDGEKGDDKKRKYKLLGGEQVGLSGNYLAGPTLHWAMFTKDAVFPTGSLGEEEFTSKDTVKVKELDLSSKDHGTPEHAKALIEALDPKKAHLGTKKDETILEPGELRTFYRSPAQCWRGRYQAVKGLVDFKLDVDKLVKQDRYKSHTAVERKTFTESAKAFLFWDELSAAEEFPTDGKATFLHPATALRLMSAVTVLQDHDDPPEVPAGEADRLHAGEDVVIIVRDSKGPLAAANVTVKAGGKVVATGTTDSAGELVVKKEDVIGQDIEISLEESVLDKGTLYAVANETGAPSGLMPGAAPGSQTTNGVDGVPDPRMGLRMKAKEEITACAAWDDTLHKPKGQTKVIAKDAFVTVERFVFRREDGKYEGSQALLDGSAAYFWSIADGKSFLDPAPEEHHDAGKDGANIVGSWSMRLAHLTDHPVLAGRVQGIADGTELEVTFCAILAQGAPEHDVVVIADKTKTVAGGFAIAFDPHGLMQDNNLLNTPKPVYARVKAGDKSFSLRDQMITCYGETRVVDPPPRGGPATASKEIVAFLAIEHQGNTDRMTLWDKSDAATKPLAQLSAELRKRIIGDGADKIYLGTTAMEMHLAVDDERKMSPADALAHQQAATRKAFPDAPDWLFATPENAWKADNGITVGICAQHCANGVSAEGKKTGCTEKIRQSNLGSCHLASYQPCQTAVQLGTPNKVKKDGCGSLLNACGQVGHDKSHCFFDSAVHGGNAEERERWYVALPLHCKGAGYPYKQAGRSKNLHVLLINPKNGAMVVCSQEDRGPGATSPGHAAVPEAALAKDELKGKGRIVGPSYEAAWKLGLDRSSAGDPVVLLAFVPSSTPLGPVAPDTAVRLRDSAQFDQILGDV